MKKHGEWTVSHGETTASRFWVGLDRNGRGACVHAYDEQERDFLLEKLGELAQNMNGMCSIALAEEEEGVGEDW